MKKDAFWFRQRKRYCFFCKEGLDFIDYKDEALLKRFISDRAKIRSRRATGTCARHQRKLAIAIKRAREMAMLPYTIPKKR